MTIGIVQRLKRGVDEELVRATRTVYSSDSNSLTAALYKGQVLPAGDGRVKRNPDCFEAVEPVTRGPEPRAAEPAAISRAMFVAFDGRPVWPHQRLALHDRIVRRHPEFFWLEVPND